VYLSALPSRRRFYGNAFSRVNSTEPGYRLRLKHHPVANANHSHRHEILRDCMLAIEQYSLHQKTIVGVALTSVQSSRATETPWQWRLGCLNTIGDRSYMTSEWLVLCTNRRLGDPRVLSVAGERSFVGKIRRGISNDVLDVCWKAKRVLILGHGPYATENARTALEHSAAQVVFGVRRHGIVCPELVSREMPSNTNTSCTLRHAGEADRLRLCCPTGGLRQLHS